MTDEEQSTEPYICPHLMYLFSCSIKIGTETSRLMGHSHRMLWLPIVLALQFIYKLSISSQLLFLRSSMTILPNSSMSPWPCNVFMTIVSNRWYCSPNHRPTLSLDERLVYWHVSYFVSWWYVIRSSMTDKEHSNEPYICPHLMYPLSSITVVTAETSRLKSSLPNENHRWAVIFSYIFAYHYALHRTVISTNNII
jgi:hypothetical protein